MAYVTLAYRLPVCSCRKDTICIPRMERLHHGKRLTVCVDAFLRCSKRCGFCPPHLPSFDELLEDNDDKLFNKINNNVEHLLQSLLLPPAVAPDHYKLRQRVHNRSLPTCTCRLTDCNYGLPYSIWQAVL